MDETRYRVVLTGELESGHELERAVELLSGLFKQPPEAVRKVFRGRPVTLKQEFDATKAEAVKKRIKAAGAGCRLEPIEADTGGLSLDTPAQAPPSLRQPPAGERITCPKCNHVQEPAEECAKCGVIFAKLANRTAGPDRDEPVDPVQEMAAFIGPNADRYLTKFEKFGGGRGFALTWHWPALFVPFLWALYRKMWLWAAVIFILQAVLWPLSSIAAAVVANYLYFRHAENRIRRIKGRSASTDLGQLSHAGGTSPLAVWIAIGATAVLIALFAFGTAKMTSDVTAQLPTDGRAAEVLETPEGSETYGKLSGIALMVGMWEMAGADNDLSELDLDRLQRELQLADPDVTDAWGRRLRLRTRTDGFTVRSAGPDGLFDTDDDLKVEH